MLNETEWEERISETARIDKAFREKLHLAIKLETRLRQAGVLHPTNPVIMFKAKTNQEQEVLRVYLFLCKEISVSIAQTGEHAILIQGWLYHYIRSLGKQKQRSRIFSIATVAVFTAGVYLISGNLEQAIFGLLFAGMFFLTFLPLFRPRLSSSEDLGLAILFVYLFDVVFLLSFLIDPIREVFDRFGATGNIAIALGLVVMTVLAVKHDHRREVGGWVGFAGWMIILGVMVISMMVFRKPPGGRDLAAWFLLQLMVFFFSIALKLWFETALITGNPGFSSFRTFLDLVWKTRNGAKSYTAILLMLGVVIWYFWFYRVDLMPYALPYSITIAGSTILLLFRPPTALVLTHSHSNLLIETVCESLAPHRALALLDEKSLGGTMFFLNRINNFRVMSFIDWKEIVHRLERIVPLVVVDTRLATEPLIYETGYMLDADRRKKAIFLVGPHGEAPALDANRERIGESQILRATERELPSLIYRFLKTGELQPRRMR